LIKQYTYVMPTPPIVRINQLFNLLQALFVQFLEKGEFLDKIAYEKYFVYCIAWSIGGLFETEEREKLHKFLESRNAPLPSISAQKMAIEKETVFDYYIDPNTKHWKQWEAEQW
jgi:dynein heavy chain